MSRDRKLDEVEQIVRWAVQTTGHPVLRIALIVVRVLASGDTLKHPRLPAPEMRALSEDDHNRLIELAAQCLDLLVMTQTVKRRRRVVRSKKAVATKRTKK